MTVRQEANCSHDRIYNRRVYPNTAQHTQVPDGWPNLVIATSDQIKKTMERRKKFLHGAPEPQS